MYKALTNKDDPVELRRHEDRLRKRLQRLGYHLSKGETAVPLRKIRLKREPVKRGYKITDAASGSIECGKSYNLSILDVEEFWQRESRKRREAEMRIRAERRKEEFIKGGGRFR